MRFEALYTSQRKKRDEMTSFKASVSNVAEDFEALKVENKRIIEQTMTKTKTKIIERNAVGTMTVYPETVEREVQFTE
jgi:hypothetical protein